MYGDAFYYELDGTLKKTSISKFLATHSTCSHKTTVFDGEYFKTVNVPSMIKNFVFMECCDTKWFFKIENAQVNLMERLENFCDIERLKILQTGSRSLHHSNNIIQSKLMLSELSNLRRGDVYI